MGMTDFNTKGAAKCVGDIDVAYKAYKKIIGATNLPSSDTLFSLHQQYHSMSPEQQTGAKAALQVALGATWDTYWTGTVTDYAASATDYQKRTAYILTIMDAETAVTVVNKGKKAYTAYQEAKSDHDKTMVGVFEGKMAALLAKGLD